MDITLNGVRYLTRAKLNAFEQLDMARKLAPAMPLMDGLVKPSNEPKDRKILILLMLSHISDANTDLIMKKCLSLVTRVGQDGQAAAVMAQGSLMFDDMSMPDMLDITMAVIDENLGDFFRTALGNLATAAKAE